MHPAFSVIFFTVISGTGYGLFMLMTIMHLFGFMQFQMVEVNPFGLMALHISEIILGGFVALAMITMGLMSSSFHLANPKNAWRAFFRFKTSWLSREAVFAVLFYPFAIVYLAGVYLADAGMALPFLNDASSDIVVKTMGAIAVLIALVTVFSTGMIYGCLKTIRQWNGALTPANYILMGLAVGSMFLATLLSYRGDVPDVNLAAGIAAFFLSIALIGKAIYYFWIDRVTGPSMNTATGFTRAQVRLLDVGHTAGTFLTEEFGYKVNPYVIKNLRGLALGFGFILPGVIMMGYFMDGVGENMFRYATLMSLVGVAVERWLFFAEARHVVNLYHGAQHT